MARTQIATEVAEEAFYPGNTRQVIALINRSPEMYELALHPVVNHVCNQLLLPNCERFQLHVSSALEVGPGARQQVLHREDDGFRFFEVPRPNLIIASMWAMTEFTRENGATNVVPGSHLWPAGRQPLPGEIVPAEMRAGDALLWMGGTLHGAGANTSNDWRYGIFLSYSLGWLRQEENQYLDNPPAFAETLPRPLRELLGYKMHYGLGFYDPGLSR